MSRSKRRALARTSAQMTSAAAQGSQAPTHQIPAAQPQSVTAPKASLRPANLFPHAAFTGQILMAGENQEQFQQLRADLIAEHQPVGLTEQILTDELAQHFWRLKRYRGLELQMFQAQASSVPDGRSMPLDVANLVKCIELKLFNSLLRIQQAAERSFYKALKTLRELQKTRGFVFSKQPKTKKARSPEEQWEEIEAATGMNEAELTEFLKRAAA